MMGGQAKKHLDDAQFHASNLQRSLKRASWLAPDRDLEKLLRASSAVRRAVGTVRRSG